MSPEFKKLLIARFLAVFGTQIQAIVLGWQMYALTKDPLYLGLVGLAEAIPALGLAMYAGYVIDHHNPLTVFRGMLALSFLSACVLLGSQLEASGLAHNLQVTALFCSSVLTGSARAFAQPSIYSIVPKLIERGSLSRASAWMATNYQVSSISGPAMGGILYASIGIIGSAMTVCVILFAAIVCSLFLRLPEGEGERKKAEVPFFEGLLSGAKFVFAHPILLPALSLDMISVLFGGVTALLPIYAADILFIGPTGLGALRAAPAAGAALTSYFLTKFDIRRRAGRSLIFAVFGFGVCIIIFAVSKSFVLSLAVLALSGAFDSISVVVRSSAVQLSSPDAMRGRISAVNSMFIGSSNELGEFESGLVARFFGAVPAALVGGVACLATVGLIALLSPTLRKLDLTELEAQKI
ncbi:MAG: MFS transporter [Bdellovibrionota bacterium]